MSAQQLIWSNFGARLGHQKCGKTFQEQQRWNNFYSLKTCHASYAGSDAQRRMLKRTVAQNKNAEDISGAPTLKQILKLKLVMRLTLDPMPNGAFLHENFFDFS